MHHPELLHYIAVSQLFKVGPINGKKLIQTFGGAEAIFKEKVKNLRKLKLNENLIQQIGSESNLSLAEAELKFIDKNNINAFMWFEDNYPARLKNCIDAPLILYSKGNQLPFPDHSISIVGTRNGSAYGHKVCEAIIGGLTGLQVQVVSGLALGIDTFAHTLALKHGLNTTAVLGHGLDRIYPQQNRKLAEEIIDNGALATDFPISAQFLPGNFPSRNRIIAGLSDATIVIESDRKGGSIITAEMANAYNRDVFAVPGKADSKYSAGCNWLIKTNKAALIENAEDLIKFMNWSRPEARRERQKKLFVELSTDEKYIVQLLKEKGSIRIDEISKFTGKTINGSATLLLELEFKNIVKSMPGKMYSLLDE